MTENRTDKSKYQSPSTGDFITAAQYISEVMVTREAAAAGKNLPFKFWNHPPWNAKFRLQVTEAYQLLKHFHPIPVIRAMGKIPWAYSLKNQALLVAIRDENKKYEAEIAIVTPDTQTNSTDYVPRTTSKTSIISKLDE